MDRLQISLFDRANGNKTHRWPLNCFRDGCGIIEVVFVRLQICLHEARCDESDVVTGIDKSTRQVLRACARFHANQTTLTDGDESHEPLSV